jgi:hypothetical protein
VAGVRGDALAGGRNGRIGHGPRGWHLVAGEQFQQPVGQSLERPFTSQGRLDHVVFQIDRNRQRSASQAGAHGGISY